MKNKNNLLTFLLGGILLRWGIDIGDLLVQMLINAHTIYASKIQLEMNAMAEQAELNGIVDDGQAIGFSLPEEECDYEYEDEEE